jgi:hypothetical protein
LEESDVASVRCWAGPAHRGDPQATRRLDELGALTLSAAGRRWQAKGKT